MQPSLASHPDVQARAAREPALARATSYVPLASATSQTWVANALANLDTLLDDHCQCELKAASNALALIGRHPGKDDLVHRLAALAREEMQHYHQVREALKERGQAPTRPRPSPYLKGLSRERLGHEFALLDDLLVCALVEARSCERFVTLAEGLREREGRPGVDAGAADVLQDRDLALFYATLARSESGHAGLFVDLARRHFPSVLVDRELERRASLEARVLAEIPLTPRMHGGNGRPGLDISRGGAIM